MSELTSDQSRLLTTLSKNGARLAYTTWNESGFYGHVVIVGNEKPRQGERFHWNTVESCIRRGLIDWHELDSDDNRSVPLWHVTDIGKRALETAAQ